MAESSPLRQRRPMLRLRYLSRAVHLVIVGAAALGALACAPSALPARDDDIGSTDGAAIEVADCDSPVGGIDLGAELEADGDFALSLAELPGRLADASELTRETGELAPFIREVLAWMLEQPHPTLGTISLDALSEGDPLAQSVALAFLDGDGVRPDVRTLRRGLHRYYACARALPLALDDLIEEAGGVDSSTTSLVERSEPKGHPRRLTVSNDGLLFLAETLVDGAVRETEAVWQGQRADGALEFLVYDDNGRLRDGSNFVTSIGAESPAAAPYACLACHRDRTNGEGFVTVFPPPQ